MSETLTVDLHNRQQAWAAIKAQVFPFLAQVLQGGHRWVLTISRRKRTDDQNRLLHAILGEIAATREWAGSKRDIETWKRLLTAAWLRARGESVEILPALDGHGVDVVFRRTSSLSAGECSELVDFIEAWRAGA